MTAILTESQKEILRNTFTRQDSHFDNHNIHSQIEYLANAYIYTGDSRYKDACVKGLDFIFRFQHDNGGWGYAPYISLTDYKNSIVFNDFVMVGIMNVLKSVSDVKLQYSWLDDARRMQARNALNKAVECVLKCQIQVNGILAGWCQNHDNFTYAPIPARLFEPAAFSTRDTSDIVRFLMSIEKPTPAIRNSINNAVQWLKQVELKGVKLVKFDTETTGSWENHDADYDLKIVEDVNAAPLWSRHYEIGTNRQIFAIRDTGIIAYEFSGLDWETRTGTTWFGNWPLNLYMIEYPAWKRKNP
jgi:PelA/Pel-15E family pectate lyase